MNQKYLGLRSVDLCLLKRIKENTILSFVLFMLLFLLPFE